MANSNPKISVVIPAYNAEKFLRETVQSVLDQSFEDWELVIVNDGSKDQTLEVAQACASLDSRIRVLDKQNGGVSSTRNLGVSAANKNSAYVIFLDADDVWETFALSTLFDFLENNPESVAAYGLASAMDINSMSINPGKLEAHQLNRYCVVDKKLRKVENSAPATFDIISFHNCIQTAGCILIRRSIFERVGQFDQELSGVADWDMWLKISAIGNISTFPSAILKYRMHPNSMANQKAEMLQDEMRLRNKTLEWTLKSPELHGIVRTNLRFRSLKIARDRIVWAKGSFKARSPFEGLNQLRHAFFDYYSFLSGRILVKKK